MLPPVRLLLKIRLALLEEKLRRLPWLKLTLEDMVRSGGCEVGAGLDARR